MGRVPEPRKTKYETNIKPFLSQITSWREQGYKMAQVARMLKVPMTIFCRSMRIEADLHKAWYEGETNLTIRLEDAAYKEAMGYHYTEVKEELIFDREGNEVGKKVATTRKWKAPSPQLLSSALKAVHPAKWSETNVDIKEIEVKLPKQLDEYAQ